MDVLDYFAPGRNRVIVSDEAMRALRANLPVPSPGVVVDDHRLRRRLIAACCSGIIAPGSRTHDGTRAHFVAKVSMRGTPFALSCAHWKAPGAWLATTAVNGATLCAPGDGPPMRAVTLALDARYVHISNTCCRYLIHMVTPEYVLGDMDDWPLLRNEVLAACHTAEIVPGSVYQQRGETHFKAIIELRGVLVTLLCVDVNSMPQPGRLPMVILKGVLGSLE